MRTAEWKILQMHYSYRYHFWSDKLHVRTLHMYIRTYRIKNKEVLCRFQKERNILHTRERKSASCRDNTFRMNWSTRHVTGAIKEEKQRRREEEENVMNFWLTLRKQENTGNLKTRHFIAVCGELFFGTVCGPVVNREYWMNLDEKKFVPKFSTVKLL